MARSAVAQCESSGAKEAVVWCPTCLIRFDEARQKGIVPRFPLIHATAFLAGKVRQLSFERDLPARVALVAGLRETSVIFGTVLACLFLKEQFGPMRYAAAVLVTAGGLAIKVF